LNPFQKKINIKTNKTAVSWLTVFRYKTKSFTLREEQRLMVFVPKKGQPRWSKWKGTQSVIIH